MMELVQEQPVAQPDRDPNSSITGDLRTHDFASRIFRNTRKLRVWLPPGYDAPANSNRYPVLYLQDGQNLFDRVTAFGGVEWHATNTASNAALRILRQAH